MTAVTAPAPPDVVTARMTLRSVAPTVAVATTSVTVFVALVVGFTDVGPLAALAAMGDGAFGSIDALSETLTRAIPLVLVGVGASLALRAGIFNVGGEGQMAMGAVAAAVVAMALAGLPGIVVWPTAAAAAMLGGALWVAAPAALWATRGVSEILSTLLVNFVTTALLAWLLTSTSLRDSDPSVITPQGERLPAGLEFPVLVDGSRLHIGLFVALAAVAVTAWRMRTVFGFRVDLVGANPTLAAQAGLRPAHLRVGLLVLSAAFAGLAGAIQLFGLSHRLTTGLTGGVGYTGVLVAVLGRSRPIATAVAALVFAALVTGGEALERDGVPRTLSAVVQGVLIVGVALIGRAGARSRS